MATTREVELVTKVVPVGVLVAEVRSSLAEYLRTSFRPDREWIAGEVRERHVGEGQHAVVQKFLAMFLGMREEEWGILVRTEQRVQVSAEHFRVPDLCLTRVSDGFEAIVRKAPLLCIEILSREDTATEMLERVDDYFLMGVPTVWMVDPRRRKASILDASGTMRGVEELSVPGTEIRLGVETLFAQLNRLEGR